jgi:hypothetical protein
MGLALQMKPNEIASEVRERRSHSVHAFQNRINCSAQIDNALRDLKNLTDHYSVVHQIANLKYQSRGSIPIE